ncbi:hypothetical protein RB608_15245 [Nocardioides sp. LHD-245]|uniref:hypothetical protein n=1 Tax=Nocardioides sp. LHD-245 TaxID=3051387 RepID=UPI0027E1C14C|nr:hypothetical protein [Nocardioides sp. LHD-245]
MEGSAGTPGIGLMTIVKFEASVSRRCLDSARLYPVRLADPRRWVGPIHEYLHLAGASLGSLASGADR